MAICPAAHDGGPLLVRSLPFSWCAQSLVVVVVVVVVVVAVFAVTVGAIAVVASSRSAGR